MTVYTTKLGPGTLVLGPVDPDPLAMDASCQVRNAQLSWDKNTTDPFTVLCGDVVAGSTTYTAKLAGTFVQDLDQADGIVNYSWVNKGTEVDFVFTPNTAAAATVTGKLIIDPLAVGSTDDFGTTMTSDFEWACVGEPVLAPGTGTGAAAASDADLGVAAE